MSDDQYRNESDARLAEALLAALDNDGDDIGVIEAEGAILQRLDVPLDETERGLTRAAVEQVERFVSTYVGRPWTYRDVGRLGVDADGVR